MNYPDADEWYRMLGRMPFLDTPSPVTLSIKALGTDDPIVIGKPVKEWLVLIDKQKRCCYGIKMHRRFEIYTCNYPTTHYQ